MAYVARPKLLPSWLCTGAWICPPDLPLVAGSRILGDRHSVGDVQRNRSFLASTHTAQNTICKEHHSCTVYPIRPRSCLGSNVWKLVTHHDDCDNGSRRLHELHNLGAACEPFCYGAGECRHSHRVVAHSSTADHDRSLRYRRLAGRCVWVFGAVLGGGHVLPHLLYRCLAYPRIRKQSLIVHDPFDFTLWEYRDVWIRRGVQRVRGKLWNKTTGGVRKVNLCRLDASPRLCRVLVLVRICSDDLHTLFFYATLTSSFPLFFQIRRPSDYPSAVCCCQPTHFYDSDDNISMASAWEARRHHSMFPFPPGFMAVGSLAPPPTQQSAIRLSIPVKIP